MLIDIYSSKEKVNAFIQYVLTDRAVARTEVVSILVSSTKPTTNIDYYIFLTQHPHPALYLRAGNKIENTNRKKKLPTEISNVVYSGVLPYQIQYHVIFAVAMLL